MAKAKAFADLANESRILLRRWFENVELPAIAQEIGLRSGELVRRRYREIWQEVDPCAMLDAPSRVFLLRLWIQEGKDLPELTSQEMSKKKFHKVGGGTLAKTQMFLVWFNGVYKKD